MADKLVLDLETKKTFDQVGGHHNSHQLGVSVCGVYSYELNQYRAFREEEFGDLLKWLTKAELIIGFNSKSFDFTVLQPYFPQTRLGSLPHLDILEEVYRALGFRLKLDSLAQETLGRGKSGDGLDAIRYYQAGDWNSLIKYCLDDVKITRDLYEYGAAHGNLWFSDGGRRTSIPVRWQQGLSVIDIVKQARQQGQQLEIQYLDDNGLVTASRIDIQEITNGKVKVFDQQTKQVKVLDVSKIKTAKLCGQMGSWQKGLF